MRDAYRVTPESTSRTSLAPMLSGPLRNAALLPLAFNSTALPEPAQLLSADWIREVSGGADSALLLNNSLLVDSVALSEVQVDGMEGCPEPDDEDDDGDGEADADGLADADGRADGEADALGVLDPLDAVVLQAAPLSVNEVGLGFVPLV